MTRIVVVRPERRLGGLKMAIIMSRSDHSMDVLSSQGWISGRGARVCRAVWFKSRFESMRCGHVIPQHTPDVVAHATCLGSA
jgi:hypothetical protein